MGWHGLNDAEAQTAALSALPDLRQLWKECALDGNPPVFYLLVRLWSFLFGSSDFALKTLALLISGAFPVIVYLIVSRRLNDKIAWQTALLTVFSPTLLYDSNMVRPYALAAGLAFICTDRLFSLLSNAKSLKYSIQYALLMSLMFYTHIFTVSIAAAHCFCVALGLFRGWISWNQARTWLVSFFFAVLTYIPWIILMKVAAKETSALWTSGPNFPTCSFLIAYAAFNYRTEFEPLTQYCFCWTLLGSFVALICLPAWKRSKDRPTWLGIFYWTAIANTATVGFILAEVTHVFNVRHINHAIGFILLLFITSMDWILGRLPRVVAASLPVLIMIFWWSPNLIKMKELSIGSVYQAVQPIIAKFDKSKDLVVCAYEVYAPECARELPKGFKLITFPDLDKVDYVYFPGFHDRFLDENNYLKVEAVMKATLERGGRIWFVEHQIAKHIKWFRRASMAGNESICELEFVAADRLRNWLFAHATLEGQVRYFTSNDTFLAERCFITSKKSSHSLKVPQTMPIPSLSSENPREE